MAKSDYKMIGKQEEEAVNAIVALAVCSGDIKHIINALDVLLKIPEGKISIVNCSISVLISP